MPIVTFNSIDTSGNQEKNGESKKIQPSKAVYGGNVRHMGKFGTLGVGLLLGAGWVVLGCKAKPDLSQANAQSMIQAKYDQSPAVSTDLVVNDLGMREGVTAKYWAGIKRYPNGYWADFKLTPDGKKLVKLPDGTDVIQWRPDGPNDTHYAITITTVGTSHPKAVNMGDIQDDGNGKTAEFSEDVNLDGLPDALQGIAHNPGNHLSERKHAHFVLTGGAWSLDSVN